MRGGVPAPGAVTAVSAVSALLASATACSIPEKYLVDAQVAPFSCLGQPLPAMASPQITIAGTLTDRVNGTMLGNTAVEAYVVGTPTPIFMTASNAGGSFTRDQITGGTPSNLYVHALPSGYLETYFYPAVPVSKGLNATIQGFTASDLVTLGAVAQIAVDTAKVNFLLSVVDCNGTPVPGASITTVPAGPIRYFAGQALSPSAVATDATGAALVMNVPADSTVINATVAGMTLRSHAVGGVAGAVVQTEIQP
jgi:hypothetical protein